MEEARSAEPSAADRLLPIVAGPVSGINQQREITGTAIGLRFQRQRFSGETENVERSQKAAIVRSNRCSAFAMQATRSTCTNRRGDVQRER
jgi:hypothetical protein